MARNALFASVTEGSIVDVDTRSREWTVKWQSRTAVDPEGWHANACIVSQPPSRGPVRR